MDELDLKILRSLILERAVSPSTPSVKLSLRAIAARLGADDMTVSYRYKKLQGSGCMPVWSLLVNPTFFGYRVTDLMIDAQPESGKPDMIRKLRLIHEITGIVNFFGRGLRIFMIYNGDESRSRTVELISRITNAEGITACRMPLPKSENRNLSESDVAIIRALSNDARKSSTLIAKELGLSAKTVRKRVDRLRNESIILPFPIIDMASIPGLIPLYLSYVYSSTESKSSVDREIASHFDLCYITGSFSDPNTGGVILGASAMSDVPKFLDWTKSQRGVASARVDIPTETFMFPQKLIEMIELKSEKVALQENALA